MRFSFWFFQSRAMYFAVRMGTVAALAIVTEWPDSHWLRYVAIFVASITGYAAGLMDRLRR